MVQIVVSVMEWLFIILFLQVIYEIFTLWFHDWDKYEIWKLVLLDKSSRIILILVVLALIDIHELS